MEIGGKTMSEVIVITSGKGGVGKTTTTANIGMGLARMKKKTVKGGSWKDPESMVRSAWRTFEYQNQPRSYIGFRCVRSMANTNSGKVKNKK